LAVLPKAKIPTFSNKLHKAASEDNRRCLWILQSVPWINDINAAFDEIHDIARCQFRISGSCYSCNLSISVIDGSAKHTAMSCDQRKDLGGLTVECEYFAGKILREHGYGSSKQRVTAFASFEDLNSKKNLRFSDRCCGELRRSVFRYPSNNL
jgi:hypothetical protein